MHVVKSCEQSNDRATAQIKDRKTGGKTQQKLSYETAPSVPALTLHYFFVVMHQEAQAALVTNTRAEEGRFIFKKFCVSSI